MGRHSAPETDAAGDQPAAAGAHLQVVRGEPTPDELAVVAAVIAAASRGGGAGPGREQVPARNRWADPFDVHQRPWMHGTGGWRTSMRPQG